MCGVVSIVYQKDNPDLGRESGALVKKLEYRGYDSTGVATIKTDGRITLRKKVGAPSRVVHELDIDGMSGQRAIGQVRWATYGSVTDTNAQPHEVRCRIHLVGAHNGNISNTDTLKEFLTVRGHSVVSDNDGEMLTHVVEHCLAEGEEGLLSLAPAARIPAAIRAIRKANSIVIGSYAACIAVPGVDGVFAMKAGSSLYAGKGSDAAGDFIVVSSDLTSVLSKTRFLIPMNEGEGLHFTHDSYSVFSLTNEREWIPPLRRSRLDIAEVSLQPKHHFFMEQEIASTASNLDRVIRYYFPDDSERAWFDVFERHEHDCKELLLELSQLYEILDRRVLKDRLAGIVRSVKLRAVLSEVDPETADAAPPSPGFHSDDSQLFHELSELAEENRRPLLVLDLMVVWKKKRRVLLYKRRALDAIRNATRVFVVGSGTSYHAALVGASFFGDTGGVSIHACNPGTFRSTYQKGLRPGDLIVGISQSGETKDLVDVINDVRGRHSGDVSIVSIVNNENSTIPQEKSDFYLPILCGPEIAVAATKSFINQIAVLYLLAAGQNGDDASTRAKLEEIRHLIAPTLEIVDEDVSQTALKLFLEPSIHILGASMIGLAREGALKIREVVLNHTEGYDSAEFKHGPNTILGKNTIFSLLDMEKLLADFSGLAKDLATGKSGLGGADSTRILDRIRDFGFRDFADDPESAAIKSAIGLERYFGAYPLIFLCPPDERDIRITVTQIHTHKIRGADVVLIAEDHDDLRRAAEGRPAGIPGYWSKVIRIPKSGDKNVFTFQAAVVLQTLAFRMSIAKMRYLNKARVENHGVHPDVPKNVSKSITVD